MSIPDFASMLPRFEAALSWADAQVRRTIERYPDQLPVVTENGRWRPQTTSPLDPAAACWPGMMWVLAEATEEVYWREQAERYSRLIESHWDDVSRPGTGFALYFGGHRRWHEATVREGVPEPMVLEFLIRAGAATAARFQPGGYLSSARGADSLTLESLLDVPLMLLAANETQDQQLVEQAARHCATVRRCLVRGDGSVATEAQMDPATGECRRWVTNVGYRGDTCWARGLAWAVLGFATAGRMLDFEPWIETARRSGQYLIEKLSLRPVPPWDFEAPADPPAPRDSSAAAVAAAALFALADAEHRVGQEQAHQRRHLQEVALAVLDTLCEPECLASEDAAWEALLKHGIGNLPAGWAVDESVVWGDAFFVEALHHAVRLLRCRS
ncbi:MAG: glycoside hydrolase family 88 protein [Planctomycetes bacterium]|nr:glycoside hydrolase family 88 protein [Planctomycetota bacterium]